MSHDLFAAFGEAPAAKSQSQSATQEAQNPWLFDDISSQQQQSNSAGTTAEKLAPSTTTATAQDDDDDFGDFEDAAVVSEQQQPPSQAVRSSMIPHQQPAATSPPKKASTPFPPKAPPKQGPPPVEESKVGRHPFADHMDFLFSGGDEEYDAGNDDLEDLSKNPEAAMEYSKRMIAEQQAQMNKKPLPFSKPPASIPANPAKATNKLQKKSTYVPAKDPNVLFDADNVSEHEDEDDDEFGDFEAVAVAAPPLQKTPITKLQKKSEPPVSRQTASKPVVPAIDLLGLNDDIATNGSAPNGVMSPRSERVTSILGGAKADSHSRPPASGSLLAKAPMQQEDDAWDDFEAAEPVLAPSRPSASPAFQSPTLMTSTSSPSSNELPPTNVPPPVILLSAFASFFATAQETLFNPLSKIDAAQRQELLTHPATHQFLHKHLNNATALAHIIAGRKLRWKRDQILAQSMRIGPSAAGGKGGMKLTSIDKSEVGKEDREVLDTVQKWKAQSGKLRGAVTAASSATPNGSPKLPAVPEIAEVMPIKTLKATEGGFTASHACALCGLKREERVGKVDIEINDSFGEWWVDGMNMHLVCKNWWNENKGKLRSR